MTIRILSMLAVAASLFAQGGPGGFSAPQPPKPDAVKAYLGLTDAQIQALQQLRQTKGQAVQSLHEQVMQKERALHDQIQSGSTDAAALGRLLVDIQSLRKQIGQEESNFHDQAVNSLNATQKAKLKTLEDAVKGGTIPQATALMLLNPADLGAFDGPGPGRRPGPFGPGGMGPAGVRGMAGRGYRAN